MAKKVLDLKAAPKLTAAQKKKLTALGIDWTKLDLGKLLEIIRLLFGLFGK